MPVIKRQNLLDSDHGLSIRKQASLLQVSRNKKYYQPKGESPLNLYLMKLIDQQYQRTPFYGVPRMTDYLNGLGLVPIIYAGFQSGITPKIVFSPKILGLLVFNANHLQ